MHTITLKINDSMYEHFLYILKNLNSKEISVVKEVRTSHENSLKKDLKKLLSESKTVAFSDIDDPVAWQRQQRDEW